MFGNVAMRTGVGKNGPGKKGPGKNGPGKNGPVVYFSFMDTFVPRFYVTSD